MPNKRKPTEMKLSKLGKAAYILDIGFRPAFARYFFTYEQAINALFAEIAANKTSPNQVSFPLLYLIRHCLELGYKANINYLVQYSDKDSMAGEKTHNLVALHAAFKEHFLTVAKKSHAEPAIEEFNKYCEKLERLLHIFELFDKKSDAFRYPINNKGKNHFEWNDKIDLLQVKTLFDEAMVLLSFTADVLAPYTDFVDSMKEYEQEFS